MAGKKEMSNKILGQWSGKKTLEQGTRPGGDSEAWVIKKTWHSKVRCLVSPKALIFFFLALFHILGNVLSPLQLNWIHSSLYRYHFILLLTNQKYYIARYQSIYMNLIHQCIRQAAWMLGKMPGQTSSSYWCWYSGPCPQTAGKRPNGCSSFTRGQAFSRRTDLQAA